MTADVTSNRTYRISAVEKAFVVLGTLACVPYRFTLSDISGRTDLSTNQTFRLLQTLIATGYARQEPETKLYSLGPRAFGLVPALFHGNELFQASRELLEWAHLQTGETVSIIVPDGEEATVCIDVRESVDPALVSAALGSRMTDLHAGAVGKLFLAYRDDLAIERYLERHEPLRAYTSRTLVTREALWPAIKAIRAQGVSISDEEVADGMYGIAAPIRDRRAQIVAAVALAAPTSQSRPAERERHRAVVIEAGRRISANMGYRAVVALG